MNEVREKSSKVKPLTTLWVLVAVCAFPMVASWLLYFYPDLLPNKQVNNGELIQPSVDLPPVNFQTVDKQGLTASDFQGFWTLMTLGGDDCGDICRQHIHDFRQIRLALGKDMYHIQRLLVLTQAEQAEGFYELLGNHKGMRVAIDGDHAFEGILHRPRGSLDAVYLIDPMGKIMMRYSPEVPASDILEDMQRLLKATNSWIGEARVVQEADQTTPDISPPRTGL